MNKQDRAEIDAMIRQAPHIDGRLEIATVRGIVARAYRLGEKSRDCPQCEGSGTLSNSEDTHWATCDKCDGTGVKR